MKKRFRKFSIIIIVIALLCYLGLAFYASDYYHADESVKLVMQQAEYSTSDAVQLEITDDMIIFRPDDIKAGFIFYPGGKVEYTAYVPLIYCLAQNGVVCVITEMPFNLAVMDINAADKALEKLADVKNWYVGGHSLGGSMAASWVEGTDDDIDGLILLASYSTADLSQKDIDVLSIYGTEDNVLNIEKYNKYFSNLPADTTELIIEGGNHAQFGCYGQQDGDGQAIIADTLQWDITVNAITEFMGI